MLSAEELFLGTLSDLENTLKNPTEYNTIRASGLLRHLLLDGLLSLVNKTFRIEIQYKIGGRDVPPLPPHLLPELHWEKLAPMEGFPFHFLTTDQFIKRRMISSNKYHFAVKDIIKLAANKLGGVHYDKSLNEKEKKLEELFDRLLINDLPNVYANILAISDIVVKAFAPLKEIIENSGGVKSRQ